MSGTKCSKPLCQNRAVWTPVVEVPTLRTNSQGVMITSDRPTLMVFRPVCDHCKQTYDLTYWVKAKDWAYTIEEARKHGLEVKPLDIINVTFKPLEWEPRMSRFMELDRSSNEN